MKIDAIVNGIVIDHITAGKAKRIYELLGLARLNAPVALIQNVTSKKMGKKDIIKIDSAIELNTDVLGFIDPDVTVSIIENGVTVQKKKIGLPKRLENVIFCKNPRCISSTEQELPHIFTLSNEAERVYRCIYCETKQETE